MFAATFVEVQSTPFLLVRADASKSQTWAQLLGVPARRCYVADDQLRSRAAATGMSASQLAALKIPNPGPVMSGDFGEILTAFYLAAQALPAVAIDPVRWRYKADRTKAAPGTDVVQMFLPSWPAASSQDRVSCAEVKAKATPSSFDPIHAAGKGSATDREGRLVKTLTWLREKALTEGSDTVEVAQLDRFIEAVDHPPALREFRAVAVIDSSLVDAEIAKGTAPDPGECLLVVISVPELKQRYAELFDEIVACTDLHAPTRVPGVTSGAGPLTPSPAVVVPVAGT